MTFKFHGKMLNKKIVFLTGTRADFGKLKSLIQIVEDHPLFESRIFATGMHMQRKYGLTVEEIEKSGFKNIYRYINVSSEKAMDLALAKTIEGFSNYINEEKPDLIVIHGDRVEALAGATVGALNNILVAHIEGGEVSGTVDELIRHSVSKLSHLHLVSNEEARSRLIQMGEQQSAIHVIGSPDVDIMLSQELPSLKKAMKRYEIPFKEYGVLMFHPVTTEVDDMRRQAKALVKSVLKSNKNYIVVYPNNDSGSSKILEEYASFEGKSQFRVFPSIRFEYFLVFLKNANFIIGNSSAGVREAPYYGVPTINIGSRQNNRVKNTNIINVKVNSKEILEAILTIGGKLKPLENEFGRGRSDIAFKELLENDDFWKTSPQKLFVDIKNF